MELFAVLIAAVVGADEGQRDVKNISGLSPHLYRFQVEGHMARLTSAYELSDSEAAELRAELESRRVHQFVFETAAFAEVGELGAKWKATGTDVNSPEAQEYERRFREMPDSMPLGDIVVADMLEAKLSPGRAAAGRTRYELLLHRKTQKYLVKARDTERRASQYIRYASARQIAKAPMSAAGNPLPRTLDGKRGSRVAKVTKPRRPSAALRRVEKPVRKPKQGIVGKRPSDLKRPIKPTKALRSASAPPLDDWDKRVDQRAQLFQFTDVQRTQAQAILRDLRRRAEHYMLSRADDFAEAKHLKDAKARRVKEAQLLKPMDAFFEELTQRLDNLATTEQQAKAQSPSKKKGK